MNSAHIQKGDRPLSPRRPPIGGMQEDAPALASSSLSQIGMLDEVSLDHVATPALEVTVSWGETTLRIAHLSPPRTFSLSDIERALALPTGEALDGACAPLVVVREGIARAIVPAGANGHVEQRDQVHSFDSARARGILCPSLEAPKAEEVLLERGRVCVLTRRGLSFRLAVVEAAQVPRASAHVERRGGLFWGVSALLHAALVVGLSTSPGASLDGDMLAPDKATQALLMQLSRNVAARELPREDGAATSGANGESAPRSGGRHRDDAGVAGRPDRQKASGHYEVQGPRETETVRLGRLRNEIESESYGALGALAAAFGPTARAPHAFDDGETIGRDAASAEGNLTGAQPGESFGWNGLAMAGSRSGGGGGYDGIGLNRVGGFGNGGRCEFCDGESGAGGFGGGPAVRPSLRPTKGVTILEQGADVSGRLPPESIRRVIRANFVRFRACYENGLRRDPGLRGTVATRFIIDSTGAVESVSSGGGTMTDAAVRACVFATFQTLGFPDPEGGKVMVTYPIDFQSDAT